MHRLFENFVRNFARRHCHGAKVGATRITWQGEYEDEAAEVLPSMLTDVTIEYPDRKIILDCKFYRDALVRREDRLRLHASHLYQLTAYLQNKRHDPGWEQVEGTLLYPSVDHQVSVSMTLLGHTVRIESVDLDQSWQAVEKRLCAILTT